MSHLPILIVAVPLVAAVAAAVVGLASARAARLITLAALASSHLAALGALRAALAHGTWRYPLAGWTEPWGIECVVDPLAGAMAVLVSFMALLATLYGNPSTGGAGAARGGVGYALHLLLAGGLLGIVVAGDAFNLFVFLEISSLAGYGLVAAGGDRAVVAAFRYLLVGTIAASFYLLGVGYLYALTGTLGLADLAARLPDVAETGVVATALALIVVGLALKIALFPLHGWLPDAYALAPVPTSSFIASVAGKVGVYVLLRFLFFVFPEQPAAARALDLLGVVAAVAVVAGSLLALAQTDLRRMLACSSVGQIGYVVLGLALANAAGLVGALLYAVNHAFMKACLFMASGSVSERIGAESVSAYAGAARRVPLSMAAFAVAGLSMIGLPPTGGFFAKWYLVLGALERGAWAFVAAIVASSLLTAVYVFRVLELAYFRAPAEPTPGERPRAAASELQPRLVPVLALALGVLGLGLFNQALVEAALLPALPERVR
jgi:multicomponent Na+:H+ antiporter subunit D